MSTTATVRTAGHLSEMLVDGVQILVGCTCGWTCSCAVSDQVTAYAMYASHAKAAQ